MRTKQAYTFTFPTKLSKNADQETKIEKAKDILEREIPSLAFDEDIEYKILEVSISGEEEQPWKTMQIDVALDPHEIVFKLFNRAETADICGSYPEYQLPGEKE